MLILASSSPRRKELVARLGVPYEICPSNADEHVCALLAPAELVKALSRRKAEEVASRRPDGLVLGVDTVVALDGRILGKPKDERDAKEMLRLLSGRTHEVYSGFTLIGSGKVYSESVCTTVRFASLSDEEIERYIASGEPADKAGAYGIQGLGGLFVRGIAGDYYNVVGFPLQSIYEALKKEFGAELLRTPEKIKADKIAALLEKRYPSAECALHYEGEAWKLLVMGRLSAQCTDARVNIVCKELFSRFPTAEALAYGDLAVIEEIVRPCGLFRTKAAQIKEACRMLEEDFGGALPQDMETLLSFPGVGRKIANLLRGDIYSLPAIVADTHCIRISERLGLTKKGEKRPEATEKTLSALIDPEKQSDFCHRLVLFGREICTARAPQCALCPLSALCRAYNEKK